MHRWMSMMALGDSFTEGLDDPAPDGTYLGWADRLAVLMAQAQPELRYANLAVRGRMMDDIEVDQFPIAISERPDLVTLCAGGNDLIVPGCDVDELADRFERMTARIRANGSDLVIFTGPDTKGTPVMSLVRAKVAVYNGHLRAIADRHACHVVDLWGMRVLRDRRAWSEDRLHFSSTGHQRIALKTAATLGIPVDEDAESPWPPAVEPKWMELRRSDLVWTRTHLLPWIHRQLRGRSMGDGLTAKRPVLTPITAPGTLSAQRCGR